MSPTLELIVRRSSRSWIKVDGHPYTRYIDVPMVDVPKSDAFSQLWALVKCVNLSHRTL